MGERERTRIDMREREERWRREKGEENVQYCRGERGERTWIGRYKGRAERRSEGGSRARREDLLVSNGGEGES